MIRFILKSALGLGLLALALPLGHAAREGDGLDGLTVLSGARDALVDLGGFCARAPKACDAGREIAVFAGERIEAGARVAFDLLDDALQGPAPSPDDGEATGREAIRTDPVLTGAVADAAPPQPYTPPRRPDPAGDVRLGSPSSAPVAVPTPSPRT